MLQIPIYVWLIKCSPQDDVELKSEQFCTYQPVCKGLPTAFHCGQHRARCAEPRHPLVNSCGMPSEPGTSTLMMTTRMDSLLVLQQKRKNQLYWHHSASLLALPFFWTRIAFSLGWCHETATN